MAQLLVQKRLTGKLSGETSKNFGLTKAAALNSAQEFASTLLEDVYEFTLKEIADFTGGGQRHRRAGTPGNALRGGSSARALAG